jgi:hypothetical protein
MINYRIAECQFAGSRNPRRIPASRTSDRGGAPLSVPGVLASGVPSRKCYSSDKRLDPGPQKKKESDLDLQNSHGLPDLAW